MTFVVDISDKAEADIEKLEKNGEKIVLKKLFSMIEELKTDPKFGTGKPEQLKHFDTPTWSRRISDKHRLVYEIHEEKVVVLLLSAYGHYSDK